MRIKLMTKIYSFALICTLSWILPTMTISASFEAKEAGIIPRPVSAQYSVGFFTITPATQVIAHDKAATEAQKLIDALAPAMGFRLKLITRSESQNQVIRLELNSKLPEIGDEGYTLDVTEKSIVIRANRPAGLFYGIQTLRQLLPVSNLSKTKVEDITWKVPCVKITDYPRFKWRGLLVDPARHFIPKAALLKFIDAMALHNPSDSPDGRPWLAHRNQQISTTDEDWRVYGFHDYAQRRHT